MAVLPDRALVFSVALHGALLLVAAANVDWRRQPRPAPAVSIKATVVDTSVFETAIVAPPTQVEPDDAGAREVQEEREAEQERQRLEAERQRDAQEAEQRRVAEEAERQRQADDAARQRQSEEAERKRQAQETERKRAAEEAERKRLAEEAERKRLAEEAERKRQADEAERKRKAAEAERQRKAEEKAARERREREAQLMAQAERENSMREQMEFESQRRTAVDSGLMAQYIALVQQKIVRNWNRPPSAREGLECRVSVKQIPGGEVVSVKILRCNGDQAVERSIEAAIRKASPLPDPPDPTLFQRDLEILFVPQ